MKAFVADEPYRFTRDPMYLSVCVASRHRTTERFRVAIGDEYREFVARVRRWI